MTKQTTTQIIKTGCGNARLQLGEDGSIFIDMGKSGACAKTMLTVISMLINENRKLGGDINDIAQQLIGHECFKGNCCVDAIGRALSDNTP